MLYRVTVAEVRNKSEQFSFDIEAADPVIAGDKAILSAYIASGIERIEYMCWHVIRSDWADLE